uniref:EGF-like domain-containing protein n=1 Tax=Strongyloides stercoralis TaxID=6248 RepID=A0AAF5DFA6_STRER
MCDIKIGQKVNCKNNGYQNLANSKDCAYPFFYTSQKYENLMKSKRGYFENHLIQLEYYVENITLDLNTECFYKIKSKSGYKIKNSLHFLKLVKKNKSIKGVVLCGMIYNFSIESKHNTILLCNSRLSK